MTFSSSSGPHRRVSLEDVAQAAGVGKSTAARALKGDKHVARKTQKVVMEAAQKLGYQPDPILSTLARERWRTREGYSGVSVALIYYPAPGGEGPYLLEHLRGIQDVAVARGYKVDVINAAELPNAARLEEVLVTRNYRGLILGEMFCPEGWLHLDWSPFCVVSMSQDHPLLQMDFIGLDHVHRTHMALRHITQAGYQRPALAMITEHSPLEREAILSSFQLSLLQQGLPAFPAYCGNRTEAGPFLNWIAENRPDAILGDNPLLFSWLRQAGLSGPDGIGLACLFLTRQDPDLAGLRSEAESVGRRAMELLDHHICTNTRGLGVHPARILIAPTWQDGPSLPPRA